MSKKGKKSRKPWTKMTARELAEATKDLDRPIPLAETRPLTAEQRQWWERAKRGPGRPRVGNGAKPVLVTIERGLLARADALAEARGVSRSQLVAEGLSALVGGGGRQPAGSAPRPRRRSARAR